MSKDFATLREPARWFRGRKTLQRSPLDNQHVTYHVIVKIEDGTRCALMIAIDEETKQEAGIRASARTTMSSNEASAMRNLSSCRPPSLLHPSLHCAISRRTPVIISERGSNGQCDVPLTCQASAKLMRPAAVVFESDIERVSQPCISGTFPHRAVSPTRS